MNTTAAEDSVTPDSPGVAVAAEVASKAAASVRATPTRTRRWRGWIVAIIAGVVLLAMIAVGVVVAERGATQLRDAQSRIDALRRELDQIAPLAARLRTLEAQAGDLRQAQELRDQHVARDLAALQRAVQTLDPESPLAERDFMLADAEYLVLAANQRLTLEQDVGTALAALNGADERLRGVEHPDLLAVRERLAADIAALRAIPVPDGSGLALYFSALQTQVDSFPERSAAGATPAASDAALAVAGWRGVLARIWGDLLGLVEIREATPGDRLTFDPVRRGLVRESLRLELATARLAVLHRDPDNLRSALTNATTLIEQYYDVAAPAVRDTLVRWRALQRTELRPQLPDLGPTIDAIRALRSRGTGEQITAPTNDVAAPAAALPAEPEAESAAPAVEEPANSPAPSEGV
jgi:uroporphyrin-3 C-methyltransferase